VRRVEDIHRDAEIRRDAAFAEYRYLFTIAATFCGIPAFVALASVVDSIVAGATITIVDSAAFIWLAFQIDRWRFR